MNQPKSKITHPSFRSSRTQINDLVEGWRLREIWILLATNDIKQRYRRSMLGPFWFTISTAISVGIFAFIYSSVLKKNYADYIAYLAVGMVIWQYIATLITESCNVFISANNLIKQVALPMSIHVYRMIYRNIIIFLHNFPVLVILFILLRRPVDAELLLSVIGLVLLLLNSVWFGMFLGILCTRFRDIPPVITNLLLMIFFLTPVMWTVDVLPPSRQWAAQFNPLYHFIEIIRAPALMHPVPYISWIVVGIVTLLGTIASLILIMRFKKRIPYWL